MIDRFYLSPRHSVVVKPDQPLSETDGPVLHVHQKIGERWVPTPGSWYAATLFEHSRPVIYIDYGQKWALDEAETEKLVRLAVILMELA